MMARVKIYFFQKKRGEFILVHGSSCFFFFRHVPLQRIQQCDLWKCYTIVDKTHRRIYYYLYPAWLFNSELLSITQTFLFHFCCCAIGDGIENLLVESDSGPTVFFLY